MPERTLLTRWLRALVNRRAVEADLDDELRFYLDEQVRRHIASSLSREDAQAAARRDLGSMAAVKDECRDNWGRAVLVDDARRDLRHAWRSFRRMPGFTCVLVGTVAFGIGATTAVFAQIDAVLLKPLPVSHPEQLRTLAWKNSGAPPRRDSAVGLIRSFLNIYTADVGIQPANVVTAFVELPAARYPGAEAQSAFYGRLTTRLEGITGVESVAIADRFPTQGSRRLPYEFTGASPVDEQRRPTLSALVIGPAYFRTVGATVLSGREFSDADGASGAPVAVVNQRFASAHWPGEDALGKRLRLFDGKTPKAWRTVVGVVSNVVQNDTTRQEFDPLVYLPYEQAPGAGMWVFARARIPPSGVATAFRREIQTIDADVPVFDVLTLDERLERNYRNNGFFGALFLMFAGIALLLASIGLYAVIAHSVSQRIQEIGLRMALGATARDVLQLVFLQEMLPSAIGLTIGLAASLAVNQVLKAELVYVSPSDPIALVVASAVLIVSAMLGCVIPARRAMRVDPVVALKPA